MHFFKASDAIITHFPKQHLDLSNDCGEAVNKNIILSRTGCKILQ